MKILIGFFILIFSLNCFTQPVEPKLDILGKTDLYTILYDENTVKSNENSQIFTVKTITIFNFTEKIKFITSIDVINCKNQERISLKQLHLDINGDIIKDSSEPINIQDKQENKNFCIRYEAKRNKKSKRV